MIIRDDKTLFDINRKATKIPLFSCKTDKYEYLTCEEILPCSQSRIIEQTKFICSILGKYFEKQVNIIENQEQNEKMYLRSMENKYLNLTVKNILQHF